MARPTTTSKRSTTRKPTTTRKTSTTTRSAGASSAKVTPVVVTSSDPVVTRPEMKKKELLSLAVERSGVRQKFAKPAIEAVLAILGETIAEGRDINVQPLGKVKVQRSKDTGNGKVHITRIRQPNPKVNETTDTPLADSED